MSGLRAARHAPSRHALSRHAVTGPARQIRPQLVRAALLPTLAAGLSGAAAVIFTLQLGGGAGDRDARLWSVLTGCALLVVGALAAALLGAQRTAKAVRDRCEALRRSSVRGRQELRTVADRLERGETPPRPVRGGPASSPPGGDPGGVDEFWLLSQELRGAREQAHATLVRLAGQATPSDSERKVEVFVNLARRLQSLVHREISLLDDLEDTVEDPDLLKELFHVDHLATRIRRHAENLAVLGGAASRRQWTRPIDLSEVLRSSVAEVEQYTRVKVVPPAGGSVRGHAVADVVHLLAELVENATVFSAPDTDVVLRAERVTAGIAVEVEDRGLGMPTAEQHRMNALLGDPDQISVRRLLADGRIGLFVVSALARRHGIAVELKSNIYGGVLAVLVLPQELLGAEAPTAADAAGGSRATSWGTGEGAAIPPLEPVRVPVPGPETWHAGSGPQPDRNIRPAAASPHRPAPAPPPPRPGATAPADPLTVPAPRPGAPAPADPLTMPAVDPRTNPTAPQPEPAPWLTPRPDGTARAGPEPSSGSATRPGAPAPAAGPLTGPCAEPGPWPGSAIRTGATASTAGPLTGTWAKPEPSPGPATRAGGTASAGPLTRPAVDPRVGPAAPAGPVAQLGTSSGSAARPLPAPGSGAVVSAEWAGSMASAGPLTGSAVGPRAERSVSAAPLDAFVPGSATRTGVSAPNGALEGAWSEPWSERVPSSGAVTRVGVTGSDGAVDPRADSAGPLAVARVGLGPGDRATGGPGARAAGDRPPLPRRRAQQHLAPQLREAPAPRRAADPEQPVHDPGLMAAFQRGFGLAQSENQV